jgi:phenylpyruvate tautomerase PptA (4-oxalocrotonate tautomerase family)
MPFIAVNTTITLQPEQQDAIVQGLGRDITLIPGKSEGVLMVDVSGGHVMYFAGRKMSRCAFVDVRCYKEAPFENKKKFTETVFKLLRDVAGLEAGEVYLSISESPVWGTNGSLK